MPRTKGATPSSAKGVTGEPVASYKYSSKRKNIPPAGLEAQGVLHDAPKVRYEYNPHLPPALRSAPEAGQTDQLLDLLRNALLRARGQSAERKLLDEAGQRPLTPAELARLKTIFEAAITPAAAQYLADALRRHEPWLEWSGKREKPWFEVEPVALHIHERISTQAILRVLAREDVQRDLFADPQQSYAQAVQFYQHDVDWSNCMILGDSLQIMASLARREDLAGRVQMIYFDPPYGIKFASNFQPQLGQRDVKDREQDLTREPEMVRAYRDTWTLGVHSYLAYLRDRLAMAKELLADTGSIFVQISDENLHRVRCLMDEVFKPENFCSLITVVKTAGQSTQLVASVCDYLLWFARDIEKIKFRQTYRPKQPDASDVGHYSWLFETNGWKRAMRATEKEDIRPFEETPDDQENQDSAIFPSKAKPTIVETASIGRRMRKDWSVLARLDAFTLRKGASGSPAFSMTFPLYLTTTSGMTRRREILPKRKSTSFRRIQKSSSATS